MLIFKWRLLNFLLTMKNKSLWTFPETNFWQEPIGSCFWLIQAFNWSKNNLDDIHISQFPEWAFPSVNFFLSFFFFRGSKWCEKSTSFPTSCASYFLLACFICASSLLSESLSQAKGLFTWRWGSPCRWDNPLRWGNPPAHIVSHFNFITFIW